MLAVFTLSLLLAQVMQKRDEYYGSVLSSSSFRESFLSEGAKRESHPICGDLTDVALSSQYRNLDLERTFIVLEFSPNTEVSTSVPRL